MVGERDRALRPSTSTRFSLSADAWHDGKAIWETVFAEMPYASAFVSAGWTDAWRGIYAPQLAVDQFVCRDDRGGPVGTCLLVASERRRFGFSWRTVDINTAGEPDPHSAIIEHNRLLACPGWEGYVARALADQVRDEKFDELRLCGGSADAVAMLQREFAGWAGEVEWRDAPYVNLKRLNDSCGHLGTISANTRAQLRRTKRSLGGDAIRTEQAKDAQQAREWFEELVELHMRRWRSKGQAGAFSSPYRRRFITELIERETDSGLVHLLKVSGPSQTIGVLLNFHANGRILFYQSGFAYSPDSRLKSGLLTHHLAIEYYWERGFLEYDFLASGPGEGRYKSSLSTDVRRLGWLSLVRPNLRTSLARVARSVLRRTRLLAVPSAASLHEAD